MAAKANISMKSRSANAGSSPEYPYQPTHARPGSSIPASQKAPTTSVKLKLKIAAKK